MEQIKIDLVPNGVMSVAHASQFDVGRSMKFLLTDEGVTYTLAGTEVITMKLRKPDGTDDTISLVNTSSSYVEWTTVDGDLDLSGVYLAEITITSGDDVLGTANFLLKVEPDPYNGKNIRIVTVGPADICTFETTLPEPYPSVTVNVLATGGNGTPDNPNPIVGYSSANITRCGKNLAEIFDDDKVPSISDGQLVTATGSRSDYIKVKPSTAYTFSVENSQSIYMFFYQADKTWINYQLMAGTVLTVTTPANCAYVMIRLSLENQTVGQLEEGSTPTAITAYNGSTVTIAFGQTVYGGVLDVTRGKLHVTWGGGDLGSLNYTYSEQGFFTSVDDIDNINSYTVGQMPELKCSHLETKKAYIVYTSGEGIGQEGKKLRVMYQNAPTNPSDFKTSVSGWKYIYELTTPFDIDLTPVQIRALVGENNVFADCEETTVQYLDEE